MTEKLDVLSVKNTFRSIFPFMFIEKIPDFFTGDLIRKPGIFAGHFQISYSSKVKKLNPHPELPPLVNCTAATLFETSVKYCTRLYLSLIHISEPTRPY